MAEIVFGDGSIQPTFEEQSQRMREDYPRLPEHMIVGTRAWGESVQVQALGGQAEPMGSTDLIRRQS